MSVWKQKAGLFPMGCKILQIEATGIGRDQTRAVNGKVRYTWFHPVCALQILTRDSVTTQVDGVVYYRIYSAVSAVANVNDVHQATFLLAQTTLRNVLGTQTLSQILSGREEIAHSIQTLLDDATELWGIRVARVEIKDVRIPVQLQRSMAAEAEATREARAKVLAAEGEMNASKSLKSASMVLAESPIALQLRYLQTLTTVATEKNSTIVFPLPMNMLEGIGGISYDNKKA
ncbi:Stomatin-like protein 3 [Lemmus lemmus]